MAVDRERINGRIPILTLLCEVFTASSAGACLYFVCKLPFIWIQHFFYRTFEYSDYLVMNLPCLPAPLSHSRCCLADSALPSPSPESAIVLYWRLSMYCQILKKKKIRDIKIFFKLPNLWFGFLVQDWKLENHYILMLGSRFCEIWAVSQIL